MTSPATSEVVESGSSKPQPPLDQASVGSWGHWEGRGHKPLERCVYMRVGVISEVIACDLLRCTIAPSEGP